MCGWVGGWSALGCAVCCESHAVQQLCMAGVWWQPSIIMVTSSPACHSHLSPQKMCVMYQLKICHASSITCHRTTTECGRRVTMPTMYTMMASSPACHTWLLPQRCVLQQLSSCAASRRCCICFKAAHTGWRLSASACWRQVVQSVGTSLGEQHPISVQQATWLVVSLTVGFSCMLTQAGFQWRQQEWASGRRPEKLAGSVVCCCQFPKPKAPKAATPEFATVHALSSWLRVCNLGWLCVHDGG